MPDSASSAYAVLYRHPGIPNRLLESKMHIESFVFFSSILLALCQNKSSINMGFREQRMYGCSVGWMELHIWNSHSVSTILTNTRQNLPRDAAVGPIVPTTRMIKEFTGARSEGRKQDLLSTLKGSCGQDQEGVRTWGKKLASFMDRSWSPLDYYSTQGWLGLPGTSTACNCW